MFAQEREVRGDEEAVLRRDLPRLAADLTAYVAAPRTSLRRADRSPRPCEAALASLRGDARRSSRGCAAQYDLMVGGLEAAAAQATWTTRSTRTPSRRMRPGAYRRAVVMAYIDNLLDWGDMLFRQYTAESVDEARMLYLLAYDLLGERPRTLGSRPLRDAEYYGQLRHEPGEYDVLLRAAVGAGVDGPGTPARHRRSEGAYFFVPENSAAGRLLDPGGGPAAQDPAVAGHPRRRPRRCRCSSRRSTRRRWCAAVASGLDVDRSGRGRRTGAGAALPLRVHAPPGPGPGGAAAASSAATCWACWSGATPRSSPCCRAGTRARSSR